MKRTILTICLILSIFLNSSAQTLTKKEQKSLARIKTHVNYLASDQLQGRGTGSAGEKLSADYISQQFKKNKLTPRGDEGAYIQKFSIVTLRMAKDSCSLVVNGLSFFLFKDFYPLSFSNNRNEAKGLLVNVGYGISAPELEYDNYKDKEVKGNIVIVDVSTPDSQQAHSRFINYLSLESRVKTAEKMGASGLIFINSGPSKDNPKGELSKNIKPSSIPVFFVTDYRRLDLNNPAITASMKSAILSISSTGHNVIAYKNNKAKNTVVIGAHHDHLGMGEIKGSREEGSNAIHNGADDNASGTSALIELSKQLKKRPFKKFNYLYIAFSAEEMGLLGSKHFIENPSIDLKEVTCMINMDMVGRLKETLIINGTGTSPQWEAVINELRKDSSAIHKIKTTESGIGSSDHTTFYLAGIPSLHFFTGQHDEYHKPSDDIETLNLNGEVKVMGKITQLIKEIPAEKMEYRKTKDEDMKTSFKVTLGIMPDYTYDSEGVRIDGVKEGKPASKAGLKKGDIIINMGGNKISDIDTYMKVLTKYDKGLKIDLIYLREGITYTTEIQF